MFVVMALVTTFMTTPLTLALYPKWYQDKVARWRRGEINWDGTVRDQTATDISGEMLQKPRGKPIERVTVYLRLDSVANVCTFIGLLGTEGKPSESTLREHYSKQSPETTVARAESENQLSATEKKPLLHSYGIRLMELTDRLSSTMKVSEIEDYCAWDPVVNVFRSFGQINNIPSEGRVSVVPESSFADAVLDMARETRSNFLLLPWSASGRMTDRDSVWSPHNPADNTNTPYPLFVAEVLRGTASDSSSPAIGILIDRALDVSSQERQSLGGAGSNMSLPNISTNLASLTGGNRHQHIIALFIGGVDDRFALSLVLQLALNQLVTATIIHVNVRDVEDSNSSDREVDRTFFASMRDSLAPELSSRVMFETVSRRQKTSDPVDLAVDVVDQESRKAKNEVNQIVVVGRRSVSSSAVEPSDGSNEASVLGVVGAGLVRKQFKASVLVVHAAEGSL